MPQSYRIYRQDESLLIATNNRWLAVKIYMALPHDIEQYHFLRHR